MKGRCSITFPFVRLCKKMFKDASSSLYPTFLLCQLRQRGKGVKFLCYVRIVDITIPFGHCKR